MRQADETSWATSGVVELPDVRLHYREVGSGPALVLLHGWPQTSHCWRHVAPRLARTHRVVMPDLRGLGLSSKPHAGYDKDTVAADVWGLLDHLGIDEADVVGHDIGGAVAFRVAASRPGAVRRLVVMEMMMPGFGVEEEFAMRDERGVWHLGFHMARDITEALVQGRERLYLEWFYTHYAHDLAWLTPEDLDEYVRHYARPGSLRAGFELYRTLFHDARVNRAGAADPLPMPVLAIGGSACMGARPAGALEPLATDVTALVIDHCGHWIPEEQPDRCVDALESFLGAGVTA